MQTFMIILSTLVSLIISYIVGTGFLKLLGISKSSEGERIVLTPALALITGFFFEFAWIEVITVPLILLKADFRIVEGLVVLSVLVFAFFAFTRKEGKKLKFTLGNFPSLKLSTKTKFDYVAFAIMILVVAVIFYQKTVLFHSDLDDSRFVVNAVDTVRTNTMLQTDPTTGLAIERNYGDFRKDLVSPWYVYLAAASNLTGIHSTIFAHVVFPYLVLILMTAVLWLIADAFFEKDVFHKSLFVTFAMVITIYGYYSRHSVETVGTVRPWQGKGCLAAIGIPALIMIFLLLWKKETRKREYFLLLVLNLGLCIMSGNGIIMGAVMTACWGLVMAINKKKISVLVMSILTILPNAIYFLLSAKYSIDMFLS